MGSQHWLRRLQSSAFLNVCPPCLNQLYPISNDTVGLLKKLTCLAREVATMFEVAIERNMNT